MKYALAGLVVAVVGLALCGAAGAGAVVHHHHYHVDRWAPQVIVPHSRVYPGVARPSPQVRVAGVEAAVDIREQAATTRLDIALENPSNQRLEAELMIPVPDGAVIRGFTFQGEGEEPSAKLLPKDEATKIYHNIVAKIRDPGLLEFAGYNVIRSAVFPVAPNGKQKVRVTYENLLAADGDRIDYALPRTESLDFKIPWTIQVRVRSKRSISTVYSPTHKLDKQRVSPKEIKMTIAKDWAAEPGPFQLSYLLERNGVTASLMAYPDPKKGGGYFLLLAGLPARLPEGEDAIRREVTLVFDRSGSMHGEKLAQVREAALQILAGLDKGEAFNIIVYNHGVDLFASRPAVKSDETIAKARKYLKSVTARGGTNIHDALVEALRQKPPKDMLPLVLFLTDGLPTVGETSEAGIRDAALKANRFERRVFTFGVGVDVNTPLLEKIASETRAASTFVLPKEDVEVKVAGVFKRLSGPVLAEPKLELVDKEGRPALGRTRDLIPSKLPDLFEGDQLVLLGQYLGDEPVTFRLGGNYLGKKRTFRFTFGFDKATTRNAFVPRLWASRKIAVLIDAIRQLGADGDVARNPAAIRNDPKLKELVDEIVRLSTEFGILTEYTAFLAREGSDLSREEALRTAVGNFNSRAVSVRHGIASVNQDVNRQFQVQTEQLNRFNNYWDKNMQQVRITTVQQVADRAFYLRDGTWVDGRLLNPKGGKLEADRKVRIGSEEYRKLVDELIKEGRNGSASFRGKTLLKHKNKSILCW